MEHRCLFSLVLIMLLTATNAQGEDITETLCYGEEIYVNYHLLESQSGNSYPCPSGYDDCAVRSYDIVCGIPSSSSSSSSSSGQMVIGFGVPETVNASGSFTLMLTLENNTGDDVTCTVTVIEDGEPPTEHYNESINLSISPPGNFNSRNPNFTVERDTVISVLCEDSSGENIGSDGATVRGQPASSSSSY